MADDGRSIIIAQIAAADDLLTMQVKSEAAYAGLLLNSSPIFEASTINASNVSGTVSGGFT